LWLSDNTSHEEWTAFRTWLRNNNYEAYANLPEGLKLAQDRAPVVVTSSTAMTARLRANLLHG